MSKAKDAEVVKGDGAELAAPSSGALRPVLDPEMAKLMELALKGGAVDSLERLVALSERVDARRAEEAMVRAIAAFKAECPPIKKTAENRGVSREGTSKGSMYAPIDKIAATIDPILQKHGLSYTWDAEDTEKGVRIICILSHVGGASRRSTFSTQIPEGTRANNAAQRNGIAHAYGRRYSLIGVLGLTTCDDDTDGGDNHGPLIDEKQVANLTALLDEVGGDRSKFLAVYGIANVDELPATCYIPAVRMLEAKRRKS